MLLVPGSPISSSCPLTNMVLCADSDGRLTGADAVRFFERSGLPRELLAKVRPWSWRHAPVTTANAPCGSSTVPMVTACIFAQVWSLADNSRRGYLDVRGFSKVRAFSFLPAVPMPWLPTQMESKHTQGGLHINLNLGAGTIACTVQAMDLISVAQRTGEVSADAYSEAYHEANGVLPPPQMMGIEEMVERMQLADADSNPFASGGTAEPGHKAVDGAYSGAPSPGPGGQFRPPAIIPPAPSPPRSVVSLAPFPAPACHPPSVPALGCTLP